MKKKFQKISKIIFIVGALALLCLVLVVVWIKNDTIEGPLATISLICILAIAVMCVFALLNFIMACVEGWKNDKKALLKRICVQFLVMAAMYTFLCITGAEQEYNVLKMIIYAIITTVGIIGGGYMVEKHKDDEEELHF